MFRPVNPKVSFPELEERILASWKERRIFEQSVARAPKEGLPNGGLFSFYEGPPTANARPGIHHVLARVFKDLVPRYKTMQGYRVPRKAGWDTHGLPVELEIEKELGLRSKPEIEAYGIAAFNERCKESVGRYVDEWTRLSERIAFWADMEHPYVTWHNEYIETCWWIFKQLWDHEMVYQDYRVTPHCPRCGTSLSDHEVSQGYEDNVSDPSVFVKFRVSDEALQAQGHPGVLRFNGRASLVAWTTTPWTLPGNTALAVKADAEYGVYLHEGEPVVIATALAAKVLGEEAKPAVTMAGRALVGMPYEPLYRPELLGHEVRRFGEDGRLRRLDSPADATGVRRVIAADYVSLDDGSGIVHIAPAFGAEDFEEGKEFGLLFAQPIDLKGEMAAGLPGAGKFAKDADKDVIRDLTERGLMLRSGTVKHTYPFCWRCHTPLLYYAKPSWYIRTTGEREALIAGNERVNWYPEHIKHGRFGNWLENNIDWAFSRERYWGTPLPFWRCVSCGETVCVGSREDLVALARDPAKAEALDDLHRPYIDEIALECGCGEEMRRVPEVADAWFDSGAMPYAQWHYPFEHDRQFQRAFPADFICEAIDQTRGWFYTLHAEATMLHAAVPEDVPDGIAYRNVICLGHIQDEKGNKMSKSRGNAVEPWAVIDAHGADATRWYMYTASPAGSSRRFSSNLVEEGLRRFLLTLWNSYSFFVSYANIDQVDPRPAPSGPVPEIDRWLLSELNALVIRVTDELEAYDPTDAARAIDAFVDDLSNWYVRRSRRRFWRGVGESDADKQSAYHTLYTALVTLSKLLAPFTPFVAEEIYQNLVRSLDADAPESVHLAAWPEADRGAIDESLNRETQLVKRVCSLGRAARAKAQIKVRQPVAGIRVALVNRPLAEYQTIMRNRETILDELNAKEVFDNNAIAAYRSLMEHSANAQLRPNLARYGKLWGAESSARAATLSRAAFDDYVSATSPDVDDVDAWERLAADRQFELAGFGWPLDSVLVTYKPKPGWEVADSGGVTVAITTVVTPELADEGLAREVVRRVQDMRREAGFDLADRITTWYEGDEDLARVVQAHGAYIRAETLSTALLPGPAPEDAHRQSFDLEGVRVTLGVRRDG